MADNLIAETITRDIISSFFEAYNHLGYGFLEHVYSIALERELVQRGRRVSREFGVPVRYKGEAIAIQRLDLVVEELVIVEVKSTEVLFPGAQRQLSSYLRATSLEVGLLLHFGPQPRFYRSISSNRRTRGTPLPAGPRSA